MPCLICQQLYTQPKVAKLLPCGHDVCLQCLDTFYNENGKEFLSCPYKICYRKHYVNPNKLITVHALQEIESQIKGVGGSTPDIRVQEGSPAASIKEDNSRPESRNSANLLQVSDALANFQQNSNNNREELNKDLVNKQSNCDSKSAKSSRKNSVKEEAKEFDKPSSTTSLCKQNVGHSPRTTSRQEYVRDDEYFRLPFQQENGKEIVFPSNERKTSDRSSERDGSSSLSEDVDVDEGFCRHCKHCMKRSVKFRNPNLMLKETPTDIVNIDHRPLDIAVITNTSGYTVYKDKVVMGNKGFPLPNPSLVLRVSHEHDFLFLYDESGDYSGKIRLDLDNPCVERLSSTGRELFVCDGRGKNVCRVDLAGKILACTPENLFSDGVRGLCVLPQQKLAVSDEFHKFVVILDYLNMTIVKKLRDSELSNPWTLAASDRHLYVGNSKPSTCVLIIALFDWSVVKSIPNPAESLLTSMTHCSASLFMCVDDSVMQLSESGQVLAVIGGQGKGRKQLANPQDAVCFYSSRGELLLVVADHGNKRLKFHTLHKN